MEWDDVFLYDFFSSTPCEGSYKILQAMVEENKFDPEYVFNHMVRDLRLWKWSAVLIKWNS